MTLLICLFAAVASTAVWYAHAPDDKMKVSMLCWMFWGASIMWTADAIFGYAELGAKFFAPSPQDMLNDAYLGLAAVALALTVWIVRLLVTDPKGALKAALFKSKQEARRG